MAFMGRTDLACEALSLQELEKVREHGIVAESSFIHGLEVFSVEVISSELKGAWDYSHCYDPPPY